MTKQLVMTIVTVCALHGVAYEWTEKDDKKLTGFFIGGGHIDPADFHDLLEQARERERLGIPPPIPIRRYIEQNCPDITDAEMVGHVIRNIDGLLDLVRVGVTVEIQRGNRRVEHDVNVLGVMRGASHLLSGFTVLGTSDVAEQLEHYLTIVTHDKVLWEKAWENGTSWGRQDKVPYAISQFQETTLKNLFPLLDDERRIALAETIMTNDLYRIDAKQLAQGVLAEIKQRETEAENPPKEDKEVTTSVTEKTSPIKPPSINTETPIANTVTEPTETKHTSSKRWVLFGLGIIVFGGAVYAWRRNAKNRTNH